MITIKDISRLAVELDGWRPGAWLAQNNIDFRTMEGLVNAAQEAFVEKCASGTDPAQAIREVHANMFIYGWEAFRQFGKAKA